MNLKVLTIILLWIANISCAPINLVVYSYNRPLLLYSFLESFVKNVSGCSRVSVIYRASSKAYDKAYDEVKLDFPS